MMMIQHWWQWSIICLTMGYPPVPFKLRRLTPHEMRIRAIRQLVDETGSIFGDLDN